MSSLAFLFPGQGSQKVGMARDLYDEEPLARAILEEADAKLGFPLTELMFEGPSEALTATENAQPAILAHSAACLAVLEAKGPRPSIVAGHSLGEYAAVLATGALTFAEAIALVRRRGELMARAAQRAGGLMAAVIGLGLPEVEAACARAQEVGTVVVANHNCPGQLVISGESAAVARALRLVKEAGATRALSLKVAGAFHSPLMEPAAADMRLVLAKAPLRTARVPVVSNVDATPRTEAEAIRDALARQITGAVLWEPSVRCMLAAGVTSFVEVGPGAVLSGLVRRIAPEAAVHSAGTVADLAVLLAP